MRWTKIAILIGMLAGLFIACSSTPEHGFPPVSIPSERILTVRVQPSTLVLEPGPPRKSFNVKVCFYGQDTQGTGVVITVKSEEGEIPWWFSPFSLQLNGVCASKKVYMPLNVEDVESGLYTVEAETVNFHEGTYSASADLVVIAPSREENQPPNAYFTYTPATVYVNTEVYFDASESEDPDGRIVAYKWRVDGSWVGEGRTFNWTFTSSGVHQVTLKVVDDKGEEGYYSENIDVQSP